MQIWNLIALHCFKMLRETSKFYVEGVRAILFTHLDVLNVIHGFVDLDNEKS